MVTTGGPDHIHPRLAREVNQHLEGIPMSRGARRIIDGLLANGSRSITPEAEEDDAERLALSLRDVLPRISAELRRYSQTEPEISASTLDAVLTSYCPFPPFCHGGGAAEGGGQSGTDSEVKTIRGSDQREPVHG